MSDELDNILARLEQAGKDLANGAEKAKELDRKVVNVMAKKLVEDVESFLKEESNGEGNY